MFTFDLQRFDSITDDDYNLKQGLRNIITSLNSKIEGEYVMASNANMTIDDVVDTIINALQQGGSGGGQQSGSVDSNFRFFDVDSAIGDNGVSVRRGTTKTVVCTGDGTLTISLGLGFDENSVTLHGRTITITPSSNMPAGFYEVYVNLIDSQNFVTRYVLIVNVTVPVVPS